MRSAYVGREVYWRGVVVMEAKKSVSCLCEQAVVVASTGDDVDCGG